MKFLWFGDMHEMVKAPENRKDDFRDTVNKKIAEIRELGKKHKVTAFLQPGDFLDAPKYDYKFLSEVIQRWSPLDMNKIIQKVMSGTATPEELADEFRDIVPIIGVAGNHELFGSSLNSLPKTSINFLNQVGMIQFATKENPVFFTTEEGQKIAITGTHYHTNIDKPEFIDDYIVEEKLGDYHIHIVHGFLTNKNFGSLFRHTTVDQIAQKTKADLTITGHDHIGFEAINVDGKLFVNPGSPVRLSNDLKEIKRRPKVVLIEITKEKGVQLKNIYLKSAENGEEVLDRSKILQRKANENKIQQIKSTIQQASIKKGSDITEIITNIADNKNIPTEIKDSLTEKVTEMIKKMTSETHNFSEYHITKVVLENFQSHGNTIIECSPKMNIFIGNSRQGKTSVLRALSWIYEDKAKDSRRYIKKGTDYAKATIHLSNGFVISRVIEKKKSGKNGYEIYNPDTMSTEYYNTKALSMVQELLAFTSMDIGTQKPVPLNFMKQGHSWFFIGNEMTSTERAKVIGGIYGTHYADAVLKEYESENKKIVQQIKDKQSDLSDIEDSIQKFNYLPRLKDDLDDLEALYSKVEALMERRDRTRDILAEKNRLESKISNLDNLIVNLQGLDSLKESLSALRQASEKRQRVERLVSDKKKIVDDGNYQKSLLAGFSEMDSAVEKLETLKKVVDGKVSRENTLKEALKLGNQIESIQAKGVKLGKIIKESSTLQEAEKLLTVLKEKLQVKESRLSAYNTYCETEKKCLRLSDKLNKLSLLQSSTEKIEEADTVLKELRRIVSERAERETRLKKALELQGNVEKLKIASEKQSKFLSETESIEGIEETLARLKTLVETKKKAEEISSFKKTIHQEALKYINIENQSIENSNKLVEGYKELLQSAGKCPVCLGTIDKATVNRIVEKYQVSKAE